MTRTLALGLAFLAAAGVVGCKGVQRPGNNMSVEERERRDRAESGLYQDDRSVGPRTNSMQPDPVGIGTASPRNGQSTTGTSPLGTVWRY